MSKQKVLEKLQKNHQDEKITYLTCSANGCWDANCVLKVHSKDDKITAIEADDTINPQRGREDAYISTEAVNQGMVQQRPCVMGHAIKGEIYAEDRITSPLKRVGGRGFGKGHFVEISWEEALDTIADKMKYVQKTYGDASMHHTHLTFFEISGHPLWPYIKGPVSAWSDHSTSGGLIGENTVLGYDPARNLFKGMGGSMVGYEAPDLFNSKTIIMWGWDPLVGWHGPVSYYLKLAKERGAKIICIDPRYTLSAEVLADQWIPIRPGTDHALALAMLQVIFEDDLINYEFVNKWVELSGIEKLKNYVMGGEDGEVKSPEWAEPITTIPAETIRELARYYATNGPCHLQQHYSVSKRHYGDYAATAAMILQALTGNVASPGGCQTGSALATPGHLPSMPNVNAEFQKAAPDFFPPLVMANNKMAEAILLRPKMEAGEITEDEYRKAIGTREGNPTPNIQFEFFMNNWLNNLQEMSKRMEAAEKIYFTCGFAWHKSSPTVEFMDIVLPGIVHEFESTDPYHLDSKRFRTAPGGMNNYFFYAGKAVNPPEGVRPIEWIWTQLANRMGVGEKYNPLLKDVPWDKWDEEIEKLYKKAYEKWIAGGAVETFAKLGVEVKATWEEFLKDPMVRVPIETPFHAFQNTINDPNAQPFLTPSGKIEVYQTMIDKANTNGHYGGKYDPIPRWKPSYQEEAPLDSLYSPRTEKYPLSLVTPVSLYRCLSKYDPSPVLRECYNHRVWINPADAKSRGLKDNDMAQVFNEVGKSEMRVYVTNKTMPGTVAMHFGGWYTPDQERKDEVMPYGVDMRGSCNLFTLDKHLPHTVANVITSGLVEVKKLED